MPDKPLIEAHAHRPPGRKRRRGPLKQALREYGRALLQADWFQSLAAHAIYGWLALVYRTNPLVAGSHALPEVPGDRFPVIFALWHGQHFMIPFFRPPAYPSAALVSRSHDAEINARVLDLAGVTVVRGSGGRVRTAALDKGGIRALVSLKQHLDRGMNVVMIADIPHGTPREAGLGIVTLAKISGRPILPVAFASSRYHVVKRSWDKTTINLPFGRGSIRLGGLIEVPRDADSDALEGARQALTREMNAITADAYQAIGRTA